MNQKAQVCFFFNDGKINTVINLHLYYTDLVLVVPLEQMNGCKLFSKDYKEVEDRLKALRCSLSKAESPVHRAIEWAYRQDLRVSYVVYSLC